MPEESQQRGTSSVYRFALTMNDVSFRPEQPGFPTRGFSTPSCGVAESLRFPLSKARLNGRSITGVKRKTYGVSNNQTRKKMGPPLGTGSPERRVSFPASFSHRSVGSSILASLSEAGGNDPRKSASKPLPPRFASSHGPSTETHPTPLLMQKSRHPSHSTMFHVSDSKESS